MKCSTIIPIKRKSLSNLKKSFAVSLEHSTKNTNILEFVKNEKQLEKVTNSVAVKTVSSDPVNKCRRQLVIYFCNSEV